MSTSFTGLMQSVAMSGLNGIALADMAYLGGTGILYTTDGGQTWTQSNQKTISYYNKITTICIDGLNAFACGIDSTYTLFFYNSSDGGATWSQNTSPSLPGINWYEINGCVIKGNTIMLICFTGLFRSTDLGANWSNPLAWQPRAIDYNSSDVVFVGGSAGGLLGAYSTDFGASWNTSVTGLPDETITNVGVYNNGNIVVSTDQGSVYTSTNGTTFTVAIAGPGAGEAFNIGQLVIDKSSNTALCSKNLAGGVFYSSDYGANWTASSQTTGAYYPRISGSNAFALPLFTNTAAIYSTDAGANWSASSTPISQNENCGISVLNGQNGIACSKFIGNNPYSSPGLVYTTDGGNTWQNAQMPFSYFDMKILDSSSNELFHGYVKSASWQVFAVYDFNQPDGMGGWVDVLLPKNDPVCNFNHNSFNENVPRSNGFNFKPGAAVVSYLSLASDAAQCYFDGTLNSLYYFPNQINPTVSPQYSIVFQEIPDPICFAEGTKILCLTADLEEKYVPIEKLTSGSIVKTFKHGYRKIFLIGKGHMMNNVEKPHCCMYTMKKTETNGLIEDLTLTGGHSILVDDMDDETKAKVTELLGSLVTIDGKFLHVCSIHPDFEQVQDKEVKTYYHFVLENDDDKDQRFGVYANGILAETPSFNQFITHEFIPL